MSGRDARGCQRGNRGTGTDRYRDDEDHKEDHACPEKIDARHLAGHVTDIDIGEGASDVSPLDLFLQRFDLLVHPLEARIDFERLAIGVERVLVVTDLLQNEAEA